MNNSSSTKLECLTLSPFIDIFLSFNIANILQSPLFAFILYLFYLQWRVQRSFSRMPHSDYLTLHMTVINMLSILGSIFCLVDYKGNSKLTQNKGHRTLTVAWYGGIFLHFLSCLDQYLAVVHPVTYIRLKQRKGIRMRHFSIFLVWVTGLTGGLMFGMTDSLGIIINFVCLTSIWVFIVACSLIILWILKRPRPGEKDEGVLSQQKRKAFYTILIILGVLSTKFIWGLLLTTMFMLLKLDQVGRCFMETIEWWFNIPTNLILPVMFFIKALKT